MKNNLETAGLGKIEQEISPEESAFRSVIKNRLIETYSQELEAAGAHQQTVEDLSRSLSAVTDWEEFSSLVSWPYVIRQGIMKQLADLSGQEVAAALRERLSLFDKYDRPQPKIGFHTSGADIKPKKNEKGQLVWDITGKETSDLGDGRLAYAADNFSGLYHEKESDNFYVVRIMNDEGKYDANQGWHKAPVFSIVAKFDTEDIYQEVEEELAGNKKMEAAAA